MEGVQRATPWKLQGLSHIKEQNQHSKFPLFFFLRIFSGILLIFSAIRNFFLGAALLWISKPWAPNLQCVYMHDHSLSKYAMMRNLLFFC